MYYNTRGDVSYVTSGYYKAVLAAGGIPFLLPPLYDKEDIAAALRALDGLILVGGNDLDCRNDGYLLHDSMRIMPAERERFDRLVVALASDSQLPTYGIGVGMQLLNVAHGGTLFLHIPEDRPRALPHWDNTDPEHSHGLHVLPDTLMDRVYRLQRNEELSIRVPSQHHQAVDDVAGGFEVTAKSPDGIVEAIESTNPEWLAFGTQFSPASPFASRLDAMIFDEFVSNIRERVAA
jgi:putative glutamine amidotransferase